MANVWDSALAGISNTNFNAINAHRSVKNVIRMQINVPAVSKVYRSQKGTIHVLKYALQVLSRTTYKSVNNAMISVIHAT
jgi:hypothetical protein